MKTFEVTKGSLLKITNNLYCHGFDIGATVRVIQYNEDKEDYTVVDVNDSKEEYKMLITCEEFELIKE